MQFRFDPEDLAFQHELHELLVREVPDWYTGIFVLNQQDHHRAWEWANGFSKRLADRGMLVSG